MHLHGYVLSIRFKDIFYTFDHTFIHCFDTFCGKVTRMPNVIVYKLISRIHTTYMPHSQSKYQNIMNEYFLSVHNAIVVQSLII